MYAAAGVVSKQSRSATQLRVVDLHRKSHPFGDAAMD